MTTRHNIMRKRFSTTKHLNLLTVGGEGMERAGRVVDALFQPEKWDVRYLVVQAEDPQLGRVLLSPSAIQRLDHCNNAIVSMVTTQKMLESPSLENDRPISRSYEQALVDHFRWPIYWLGQSEANIESLNSPPSGTDAATPSDASGLHSAEEICGYQIQSQNGPAGVLQDLILDLDSWRINLATAKLKAQMRAQHAMFSTQRIEKLDWKNRIIYIDVRVLETASTSF